MIRETEEENYTFTMEKNIAESLKTVKEKVKDKGNGGTAQNMKDNGKMIREMEQGE